MSELMSWGSIKDTLQILNLKKKFIYVWFDDDVTNSGDFYYYEANVLENEK